MEDTRSTDQTWTKTSVRRALLPMGLVIFLGGCTMVGPDYEPPEAEVREDWIANEDPRIKSEPVDYRYWWKVMDDPVLDQLVARAYSQNLTLHQVAVRILESRAVRAIAVGNQYPQLQQLRGGYTRNNLSENSPGQRGADHAFGFYDVGFDVSWELDIWGKFGRAVEATTADLEADIAAYDDFVVSLAAEVAAVYVQIRTFERRLELAQTNVGIQDRSLRIATTRFDAGAVTELDVTQASTLLNDTRATIPQFRLAIRQLENGLSVLLGIPPQEFRDAFGAGAIPAAPTEVAVGLPADLLRRRPDVRRAERLAAAQCARIGIAESELYPSFSLLGSLGLETGDSGRNVLTAGENVGDLFEGRSIALQGGAGFVLPIFNYGRLKNNVRAQDARFQQLILNYQESVLRAAAEVEDATAGFLLRQEQAAALALSVAAAERANELVQTQYTEGLVDYQRVLDSQRALSDQQDFLATIQGEVIQNLIALYKALGGGWEVRRVADFVPEDIQDEMRQRSDWDRWLPADVPGELEEEKRSRADGAKEKP